MPNTQIQLKCWDLTLSYKITEDAKEVERAIRKIAGSYCFQGEDSRLYNEDEEGLISDEDEVDDDDDIEAFKGIDEWDETPQEATPDDDDDSSDDNWENHSIFDSDEYESDSDMSDDSCDSSNSSNSNLEDEGFLHWQIRLNLFKRKRKSELLKMLNMTENILKKAHISPTSNHSAGDVWYVMKSDTKITPTYTDKNYEEEIKVPNHISHIQYDTLKKWQLEIIDRIRYSKSHRNLNILIDNGSKGCAGVKGGGGVGKTSLLLFCVTHTEELGFKTKYIPMCESYKDVMGAVYGMGEADCYIIDLPRSIEKNLKSVRGLCAGLESVRNGMIVEHRFQYRSRIQNTAEIWAFSNVVLNRNLLSADRWVYWCVGEDEELYLYPSMKKGIPIEYPVEEEENEEIVGDTLDIEENDSDCYSDVSNELLELGYLENADKPTFPNAVLQPVAVAEPIPIPKI